MSKPRVLKADAHENSRVVLYLHRKRPNDYLLSPTKKVKREIEQFLTIYGELNAADLKEHIDAEGRVCTNKSTINKVLKAMETNGEVCKTSDEDDSVPIWSLASDDSDCDSD